MSNSVFHLHPIMKNLHGSEKTVIELVKRFAEDGYSVSVCSLYIAPKCRFELKKYAKLYVLGKSLGLEGFSATVLQYLTLPLTILSLSSKIKSNDVVIAHAYGSLLLSTLLKLLRGIKVIYYCQEPPRFAYDLYEEWKKNLTTFKKLIFILLVPILRIVDHVAVGYMDVILANSAYSANYIQKIYNRQVVPCFLGTDVNLFSTPVNLDSDALKNYQFPLLLTVGKLHLRKNIKMQLGLLKKFMEMGKKVTLVVVGDGPQKSELIDAAKKMGILDHALFTGAVTNQTELAWYYQNCDVFIFTAKKEPFGLVVIEAMAAGKPVVVPDEGGPKEIVLNGLTGFVYKQGNLDDLCNKVEYILNNSNERKMFEREARKRATDFTWEKTYQTVSRIISNFQKA